MKKIRVLSPLELIASKVISYHSRRGKPKAGTDWRDLAVLLLRFPELKEKVAKNLRARNVGETILGTWAEIERQDFQLEDEDEDLIFYIMSKSTKVIIERHEDGFIAYPLGLKGVIVGEGDTFEDALADVKSPIRFHIETFGEDAFEDDSPVLEAFVAETGLAA